MTAPAEKILTRSKLVPWQELDGNIILLTPHNSSAHELNEMGSWLWRKMEKTEKSLVEKLIAQFEVVPSEARSDVRSFVSELEHKGIIQ